MSSFRSSVLLNYLSLLLPVRSYHPILRFSISLLGQTFVFPFMGEFVLHRDGLLVGVWGEGVRGNRFKVHIRVAGFILLLGYSS